MKQDSKSFVEGFLVRANRSKLIQYTETITNPTTTLLKELHSRINPMRQRALRSKQVERISTDIKNKRWKYTCDPIVLSMFGDLIQGQHRLTSFLEAGFRPDEIILGATKDELAFRGMDTGVPRRPADLVKNRTGKYTSHTVIAAVVYEASDFKTGLRQSPGEQDMIVENYDQLEVVGLLPTRIRTGMLAAALRCARLDQDLAVRFFSAASRGEQDMGDGIVVPQLTALSRAMAGSSGFKSGDLNRQIPAYFGQLTFKWMLEGRVPGKAPSGTIIAPRSPAGGWGSGVEMPISLEYVEEYKKS